MKKTRVCLFAGYDAEGIIDSYVISYIKELSKFCDVYYLADSYMSEEELSKLYPYVINAWSCRHGEYDFGSYSRLIKYFVGWEEIAKYENVLLVNDSCYLIKPLDDIFKDMSSRNVDWWGLQATKGISKTRFKKSNRFTSKINMDTVRQEKLLSYENEYFYDFLVGSYFLCFSNKVVISKVFRLFIDSISKENNKLNIIRKYEIGLTRLLINSGFSFDTYMKDLYPFHPIFTDVYFRMVENGFPLLKRFFLTQNHYYVKNLYQWESKLRKSYPTVNIDEIKTNLLRVCDPNVLRNNLNIKKDAKFIYARDLIKKAIKKIRYHHSLNKFFRKLRLKQRIILIKIIYRRYDPIFKIQDNLIPKSNKIWIFPTCAYEDSLTGNDLAVFYEVKDKNEIKKVILYRHTPIDIKGQNVEQFQIDSKSAKNAILKSGVIFIKHNPMVNTKRPINGKLRKVICLWHGIPLKRIGCASLDFQNKLDRIKEIHKVYHSVICSSEIDRLAMVAAFQPLEFKQFWLTGLPRTDFLLKSLPELPISIRVEIEKLELKLMGRKLIFFCPTFKNGQGTSYYQFNNQEISHLKIWLDKNNAVLGIREHMASKGGAYFKNLSKLNPLDLSSRNIVNIEAIYRVSSLMITDYSSAYIDFMITNKPIISFAYDRESYLNEERGLFYDFESAVPGPICGNFNSLMNELNNFIENGNLISKKKYNNVRKIFYKFTDKNNTKRLVEKIYEQ